MSRITSPDGLEERRKESRPKSKIIFFVVICCVAVILLLVVLKMNQRQNYQAARPDESLFRSASDSAIQSQLKVEAPPDFRELFSEDIPPVTEPETLPAEKVVVRRGPKVVYKQKEAPKNDPLLKRVQDMKLKALLADSNVDDFQYRQTASTEQSGATAANSSNNTASAARGGAVASAGSGGGAGFMPQDMEPIDPNGQMRKEDFFYNGGSKLPGGYLNDIRKPQITPYELKIGTVIPAALLTAIESDLPGQLLAFVTNDVYDTATMRHLLVPQGSRLIGIYDSQISYGQKRVMVIWTHLVMPDGSSLTLGGMPGSDRTGRSGFRGRVDNHFAELFLAAVVTSSFNLAYEVLTDDDNSGYRNNNSTSNKVKDAAGSAVATLGAKIAERELRRQPTITIKTGYRFNVTLNKDVVFPAPWQPY